MQNIIFGNFDFKNELGLYCLSAKSEFINTEAQTIEIPGARGNFYQGSTTQDRKHEVEFLLEARTEEEHLEKLTELNKLFRQFTEARVLFKLNLSKQPDIFYDSYISGISAPSLMEGTFNATFTITFLTPSGTGYKENVEHEITGETQELFIEGNSDTYPIFRGMAKQNNITSVSINSKKDYIHLGNSLSSGITPESKRTRKLFDTCDNPALWSQLHTANPFNTEGQMLVPVTTNGYSLSVSPDSNWGTPTDPNGWHGGGISREIDTTISNYKVNALLRFSNKYPRAIGAGITTFYNADRTKHLQIEIKDEENGKRASLLVKLFNEATGKSQTIYNGETVLNETEGENTERTIDYKITTVIPGTPAKIEGSLVKVNIWKAPYWDIQANAGNDAKIRGYEQRGILLTVKQEITINGQQFYKLKSNTFIRKADVVMTSKKTTPSTKQTTTVTPGKLTVEENNGANEFSDFYGWVNVIKTGNRYEILIEKVSIETGLRTGRNFHTIFYDTFNDYSPTAEVKYVTYQSLKKRIEEDTKGVFYSEIWAALAELHIEEYDDSKKEQVLLNTGDEIVIDTETNKVYRNGQLFMENLALGSTFFSLLGEEYLSFSNSTEQVEWKLFYKPRYN